MDITVSMASPLLMRRAVDIFFVLRRILEPVVLLRPAAGVDFHLPDGALRDDPQVWLGDMLQSSHGRCPECQVFPCFRITGSGWACVMVITPSAASGS